MAKLNIKTGAAAFTQTESTSNRIGFFKKPVKYTFLNTKTPCSGIILPAFDPTYSDNDPMRGTSVGSYREDVASDGMHKDFTNWLIPLQVYTFFGKSSSMIISPSVAGLPDPIAELRNHVKYKCKDDSSLQRLIEKAPTAGVKDPLALPFAKKMGFMNAWCTPTYVKEGSDDVGETNRVLIINKTASQMLFDTLNTYRPAFVKTPNDERWDEYLYGDVTNPACALRFNSVNTTLSTGIQMSCLSFGNPPKTQPVRAHITAEMLAGRVALEDDEVLNIPSYEELVDLLLDEGLVPYDLIARVCSDKYNGAFPRKSAKRQVYTPDPDEEDDDMDEPTSVVPSASHKSTVRDEEDDLDYSSPVPSTVAHLATPAAAAPMQTPAQAAAPVQESPEAGGLSPEEKAELAELRKVIVNDNPTMDQLRRFKELNSKNK